MTIRLLTNKDYDQYNKVVSHIMQSWGWGEFRKKVGMDIVRLGVFEKEKLVSAYQLTIHPIPYTKFTIGYLPKSDLPQKEVLEELVKIGGQYNCLFIKLEPNVETISKEFLSFPNLQPSPKEVFAKHTFLLDLTKSEEELLSNMHPKTRYNIKLAQRHGVTVAEKDDPQSLEIFIKLQKETASRQKFFVHHDNYYRQLWETLKPAGLCHLFCAFYQNQILTCYLLFKFGDTLYYPYGASTIQYKETMAPNLLMWETIRLGKKLGLKTLDMWGALGENANSADPWYGFHRFKAGYGGRLVEYIGTYDLVLKPNLYKIFLLLDKLRWAILRSEVRR